MTSSNKQIKRLFANSENISNKEVSKKTINSLPLPVKRYFEYTLSENQKYISYVRLKHSGKFKPKDKWQSIKGEEYFTTETPGFFWKAKVPFISAKDLYIDGKGNLVIKLLSLFKVVDEKGPKIDQGELLRWLGEAPLYPTALLPSDRLIWEAIDDTSAKVTLTDKEVTVEGIFTFNELGQIITFSAKRYREQTLEDWTGRYDDYREVDGVKIPFHLLVEWNLDSGTVPYVDFTIETIEFNRPEIY